jgi:transitional endoplasmic reticulum ATPase
VPKGGIGIEISVCLTRSNSRYWPQALALLEAEPTHQTGDGMATGRHTVTFDQAGIDRFHALMRIAGGWRGTELRLDGRLVDPQALDRLLTCYAADCQSASPGGYCAGCEVQTTGFGAVRQLFPCRLLPISEANHLGWFTFGRMHGEVFRVDKACLRERIDYYLNRTLASHCPALDRALIGRTLAELPELIDPRRDAQWAYRHGWVNGRYHIVGVEKRQQSPLAPVATVPQADADAAQRDVPTVRYADIGGIDGALRRLREAVELPLRHPELYERLGITPHNGVLLYGPPGTGKTLLAKALATEASAHFICINGPEIISKFHGESERALRELFAEAKEKAPTVILMDEIDAIAPDRATITQNFEAVLVSQLLTLMDGLVERGQVTVIGTTNRPDNVDPALRRPGRLDLLLEIGLPDEAGRQAILRIHTRNMPLAADVSLADLARATGGFSGAMLAGLCREAGLACLREKIDVRILDDELPACDPQQLTVTVAHFSGAVAELRQAAQGRIGPEWER